MDSESEAHGASGPNNSAANSWSRRPHPATSSGSPSNRSTRSSRPNPSLLYSGPDHDEATGWAEANRPADVRVRDSAGETTYQTWSWAGTVNRPTEPEPVHDRNWLLVGILIAGMVVVAVEAIRVGEPFAAVLAIAVAALVIVELGR